MSKLPYVPFRRRGQWKGNHAERIYRSGCVLLGHNVKNTVTVIGNDGALSLE